MRQARLARRVGALAAAARGARRELVLEEPGGGVLLERVDDGAVRVGDQQLPDVPRVQLHADEADLHGRRGARLPLAPEVGQAEAGGRALPVEVVGAHVGARLHADEGPVQARVGDEAGNAAVRGPGQLRSRVEVPDGQLVVAVEADQPVGHEAQLPHRRRPPRRKPAADAPVPEHVDLPGPVLGLAGAHREQRLHRVVGQAAVVPQSQKSVSSEPILTGLPEEPPRDGQKK